MAPITCSTFLVPIQAAATETAFTQLSGRQLKHKAEVGPGLKNPTFFDHSGSQVLEPTTTY